MKDLTHFRRCHVCNTISTQNDQRVERCEECGKAYAEFFYFDDKYLPVPSDFTLRPPLIEGEYQPIYGLTSCWSSF